MVVTGGAGYIGSLLTGELLRLGIHVTVVDDLLFGGESLLAYLAHPNFHFVKANVWSHVRIRSSLPADWPKPEAIVHLAAIVGFPACQAVGRQVAWRYNVEATERVFEQANHPGREALGLCFHLQQLWPLTGWKAGDRRYTAHPPIAVRRDEDRR